MTRRIRLNRRRWASRPPIIRSTRALTPELVKLTRDAFERSLRTGHPVIVDQSFEVYR